MHFSFGRQKNKFQIASATLKSLKSFHFIVGMATAACVCVTSVSRHNCVTVLVWV